MLRFSLRELILITVIAVISVSWVVDQYRASRLRLEENRYAKENERLREELTYWQQRARNSGSMPSVPSPNGFEIAPSQVDPLYRGATRPAPTPEATQPSWQ
jgi:hypothetical protein